MNTLKSLIIKVYVDVIFTMICLHICKGTIQSPQQLFLHVHGLFFTTLGVRLGLR